MSSDFGEDAMASTRDLSRELENFLRSFSRNFVKNRAEAKAYEKDDAPLEGVEAIRFDDAQAAAEFADHVRAQGYQAAIADALTDGEREAFEAGTLLDIQGGNVVVMQNRDLDEVMRKVDFALNYEAKRPDVREVAAQERAHAKELAEKSRDAQARSVAREGRGIERGLDPNSR